MKLSRSTVILPLASLLVIGGAGAVFATSGSPSTGGTDAIVPAAESASPGAAVDPAEAGETILTDVLTGLVTKGTITESQKAAIVDAVTAERTARREARQAERTQVQGFLSDGVITQEEFDQLPADSRLRALTDIMADGQITTDELRGIGRGFGFGGGGRGGHGGGPFGDMPDATAAPSS